MNIPNLPFLEKKKNEYFLSLVLRDEKASAVVFQEVQGRVNVVGEHNEDFKTSIEDATEEELLNVLDRAVSIAEKSLPEGEESQKTIFGVKESWVEEGRIKKDYLTKLKKVSDELQFKPVGFLVITEAIAHLLQVEEGAPVSAILAEIGHKNVTVSLTKAGKILETKSAPIAESHAKTVENLLKHFTTSEILPSRIVIFDGGSDKLQQEFISHKWGKELGFLHVPQITNLPSNYDARAVLKGAAMQMGFGVLEATLAKAARDDEGPIDTLGFTEENEDKTLAEAASEFGFTDGDVKVKGAKESLDEKPKTAVDASIDPKVKTDNLNLSDQFKEIPEENKLADSDKKPLPVNAAALTLAMRSFFGKIKLGSLLRGGTRSPKKLLLIGVPLLLLLLVMIYYFFGRTATVTLGVNTKETDKTEDVTFSETASTDASKNILNVEFITSSQDGKETTPATGKKETGDKAKGTVTIFNSSDTGKTLPAGTVITSSVNELKFVTDKAVTVASASGDIFSGTEPGKADVSVTAEKFGTNYNVPSNTKFTLDGTSSIAAKNDKAFSGGTKKDIKVVSQKDLDKLTKDLQKKLESSAKNEIEKKAGGDVVVLPNFVSVKFDKKSFSKKVDEEANEVSLTGIIVFEAVSYDKSELIKYAKEKLESEIPSDLEIDEENIDVSATDIEEDNGEILAKVKINAGLIPKIDEKEITKEISGKSTEEATRMLQAKSEVEKVKIDVFPPLPILSKTLPFSPGKIKIVVIKNG